MKPIDFIKENYPDSIVLIGFDDAIIGVTPDDNVIYDFTTMVDLLMMSDRSMTREDAHEWLQYNTVRSLPYMTKGPAPVIMYAIN